MKKITEAQKEDALLHATVWEAAFSTLKYNSENRQDVDQKALSSLATFALIVGCEYRRVANTGEINP